MKCSRLFPIDRGGDDPVLADVGRPLPLVQRVLPDEAAAHAAHAVAGSTIPAPSRGVAAEDGAVAATAADVPAVVPAGAGVRGRAAPTVAEHVAEAAPKPLGHDAVEERVDAAAQVVPNT